MNILPVDRALSIYGALADRSETKDARERLSNHLMKMYIEGEKDEHRLTVDGLSYLYDLDRENDSPKLTSRAGQYFGNLARLGIALLPQGIAPRYSRFRGADCFRPCWSFFRLRRLFLLSDRWHHRQHLCRHCRDVLNRLHYHWAGGRWSTSRHARHGE